MAARLAEEWFAICGGCEVTILDIGEPLLDVLKQVEIVHMPVLMDHKLLVRLAKVRRWKSPPRMSGLYREESAAKNTRNWRRRCARSARS
jgi:F420-non-reducing hydrogenase small subunit